MYSVHHNEFFCRCLFYRRNGEKAILYILAVRVKCCRKVGDSPQSSLPESTRRKLKRYAAFSHVNRAALHFWHSVAGPSRESWLDLKMKIKIPTHPPWGGGQLAARSGTCRPPEFCFPPFPGNQVYRYCLARWIRPKLGSFYRSLLKEVSYKAWQMRNEKIRYQWPIAE